MAVFSEVFHVTGKSPFLKCLLEYLNILRGVKWNYVIHEAAL